MTDKTCCFIGCRSISLVDYILIKRKLRKELINLINQGVIYFGSGADRGFDTLVAKEIIKLRKHYPTIRLILVLPFANHTADWDNHNALQYDYIARHADKIRILSAHYYYGCMYDRNRHLINNSSYCIYYKKSNSKEPVYSLNSTNRSDLKIIEL